MKNQYFADTRDLFKYDLSERLVKDVPFYQATFVPLLTPDDGSTNGKKKDIQAARVGELNHALAAFLNDAKPIDVFISQKYRLTVRPRPYN